MKKSKIILSVLAVLILAAAVATGYFLLKSMQTSIDGLTATSRLADKEAKKIKKEVDALRSAHEELGRSVVTHSDTIASLDQAIKATAEKADQVKTAQDAQAIELAALRERASKFDGDMKNWQVDYLKALTGLEEKVNIKDKQLQDEIAALTSSIAAKNQSEKEKK